MIAEKARFVKGSPGKFCEIFSHRIVGVPACIARQAMVH